eukprot:TRINITY_DN3424_c0_g1_i1.p4 TRINITY_DN3424_c0_g1~~TRINITY_DN3424_c0_g1_i1.p4  ORF type:complete len:109 (+),score=5.58 TRINITY_DN3424_c0_g1_i1:450-776(+)
MVHVCVVQWRPHQEQNVLDVLDTPPEKIHVCLRVRGMVCVVLCVLGALQLQARSATRPSKKENAKESVPPVSPSLSFTLLLFFNVSVWFSFLSRIHTALTTPCVGVCG